MNEAHENHYLELDSGKTETEPTIYDEVVAKSSTPAVEKTSYEMCSRQAVKKLQTSADPDSACQPDTVFLRRMLFFMSAVAVVALLTAAAALFLAMTAIKENQSREAKHAWKKINATVEETGELTNKEKNTSELWLAIQKSSKRIDNLSALLPLVNASLDEKIIHVRQQISQFDQKVNNMSKMTGPIGPPGFNGSQGTAGSRGAGDFSSCQYKVKAGDVNPGTTKALVDDTEPTDKIILGATCSTNFAPEYNLLSQQQASGKWKYVCSCRGTSSHFAPRRGVTKQCFLHYWECSLAT